jgi:hypothetical protein
MRGLPGLMLAIPLAIGCGDAAKDGPSSPVVPTSGQTWWANLDGLELLEPEEAGGLLDLVAPDYPLLLSATDVTDSGFAFLFALAHDDGTQDHCSRTIAMNGITLTTDGHFEFGPEDFTLANGAVTEDLQMTGQFSDDLSSIHSIAMKGTIRLNSIPEDLLPLGGVDICELLESIDINCGECRDGSDRCLSMHMVGVTGSLRTGVTVQTIAEADSFDDCMTDTGIADE